MAIFQSTPGDDLAGGVRGGHRDQVHARHGWLHKLREVVWQTSA